MSSLNTAFFSASDKSGLPEFAQFLTSGEVGEWKLWSSGGTCGELRKAGLVVGDMNAPISEGGGGAPVMMNHRVATLHPNVHAPILSRGTDADRKEMEDAGCPVERFDLVYVNLYPFKATYDKAVAAGRSPEGWAEVVEKIDIGGMSLLHGPTKGQRIVLHSPDQFDEAKEKLQSGDAFSVQQLARWAAETHAAMIKYLTHIMVFEGEVAAGQWHPEA